MKYEGLGSTVDTTGTFYVHRCWDDLDISSDLFGTSKNQGVERFRLRPRLPAKRDGVFGCLIVSMSSVASPGTVKT